MAQRLYLFCDSLGRPLNWLALDAAGSVQQRGQAVPTADLLQSARSLSMLMPGTEVSLYQLELPVRSRTALQKAVPYALEEQIAGEVETLHFALQRQIGGGEFKVAVVGKERLQEWLASWSEQGLQPDHVFSELDLLTTDLEGGELLLWEQRALLALPDGRRLALEPDLLDIVWSTLDGDRAIGYVEDARRDGEPCWPEAWRSRRVSSEELLAPRLAALPSAGSCDLLQQEFKPQREQIDRAAWRPVAWLALAVVLMFATLMAVDFWQLNREQALLDSEIERLFFVALPEASRYSAPQERVSQELQRLRGGGGSSGLVDMLRRVAPVLAGAPSLQLSSVVWRDGVLEIGVSGPDVRSVDGLRESLATLPGLQIELLSASPRDERIDGRLRISGAMP